MRILLTNDDGADSVGIRTLASVLRRSHEVAVVAPSSQRSAAGHGISLHAPVTYSSLDPEGCIMRIAADGTPADCVKLAALYFLKDSPPDLVISGINEGANIGSEVIYSGTVSAALEGAYLGFRSIAVSNTDPSFTDGYAYAAEMLADNLDRLLSFGLPPYTALNINYPRMKHKGIKIVGVGINRYSDSYTEAGERALKIGGYPVRDGMDEDTDVIQIENGYVTVSPVTLDRNDYAFLDKMKRIGL